MRTLLKDAFVVNVFTDEVLRQDVLIDGSRIVGVGDYADMEATVDRVENLKGLYVCPGFIDGHIHIESTEMLPANLARVAVVHGTTGIVCDPHEIANVCGLDGIDFMLQASEGLPMDVYVMLPSCVPSSPFDESGAVLTAADLRPYYGRPRVLGLAEMMNFPGVVAGDSDVLEKISDARARGLVVNGHAPLLCGHDLDAYICQGIWDDHECSQYEEALERLRKGQTLMIREGTAARNLRALLPFFDGAFSDNCILVSDDRDAAMLIRDGHIDDIIRRATCVGKNPVVCIRMASYQTALHFNLQNKGAVCPGYDADILVLDDLYSVHVRDVYKMGVPVVRNGELIAFPDPVIEERLVAATRGSMHVDALAPQDFAIEGSGLCNVVGVLPKQVLTEKRVLEVSGPDVARDIAKVAVIERHHNTGMRGLCYAQGLGLACGAIASSVSHDSHNLIVAGMDDESMATAANRLREIGGGFCVVRGTEVLAELPLPIAGLMSTCSVTEVAAQHAVLDEAIGQLGVTAEFAPFMALSFISLPVIPSLKITAQGLVDVDAWTRLPLFVE